MGPDLSTVDPLVEGRVRPDRLGRLGHTLAVDPPTEGREVRVDRLIAGDLDRLVDRHADRLGSAPSAVAASLWANYLVTVACPPVLAAWTLHDVGLDASSTNLAVHLEDGLPRQVRLLDAGQATRGRPDRDLGPETLVDTLAELFEALANRTAIGTDLLFNHVGNLAAYLFDRLDEAGLANEDTSADRRALLDEDPLPWGRPNPFHDPVRYEPLHAPGLPEAYQVRRRCCLKVAVDDKSPCASCPGIDADRRVELVRQRRKDP